MDVHELTKQKNSRSSMACIRCKSRKTKCTGLLPCGPCIESDIECVYPRKPKKIKIYDTEIEEMQFKIKELTSTLNSLGAVPSVSNGSQHNSPRLFTKLAGEPHDTIIANGHNGSNLNIQKSSYDTFPTTDDSKSIGFSVYNKDIKKDDVLEEVEPNELNLSIWLKSGSCELICWTLNQFMNDLKNEDLTILPDFNSFIEENVYDSVLYEVEGNSFTKNITPLYNILKNVGPEQIEKNLQSVVEFINIGYLTINPYEFRESVKSYFVNSRFIIPNTDKNDYFLLKLLMILTLGEVYDENACLSNNHTSQKFREVPGLEYFKIVILYLPSHFQVMNFQKFNIRDVLQIIELFGLIAIYCRVLDKKNSATYFTLIALQLSISLNIHKDSILTKNQLKLNLLPNFEYNNKIFWSIYCLNRFFSIRIGQPLLLNYKDLNFNSLLGVPDMLNDRQDLNSVTYYIELAHISEVINMEIYNSKFNSRDYLNSIIKILSMLIDWSNNLPDHLKLNMSVKVNNNDRLISTLHLNYLHHIYLTCIPILLHFAKLKVLNFKHGVVPTLNLNDLPKNISNLIIICIQSSQLTINIFTKLYEKNLLRSFGFTDLDYLYSCSLIFLVGMVLNLINKTEFKFTDYLQISLNFISEMKLKGNLVASLKFNQIIDLMNNFNPLFESLGYGKIEFIPSFIPSFGNFESNNEFDELLNLNNQDNGLNLNEEDLLFMKDLLKDFDDNVY